MAQHFDLGRSSKSAAHFDEAQLRHWQREAVTHATTAELSAWLAGRLERVGDAANRDAFIAAVRGNLLFPADVEALVAIVCDAQATYDDEATREVRAAGAAFFEQALVAWSANAADFKAWARAVGALTARKGAALYMPLRAALTGRTHGPELAPLVALMGEERVAARLAEAGARAAAG
jgi:glutamyl-tRNA synthetase